MGEGWVATTLGEIADYQNGYPFKPDELGANGLPVIRIKQLLDAAEPVDRSLVDVQRRHHISDGDLIFSWSGTLAVRLWDRGPALLNQHLFRVDERAGIDRRWLRLALDHAIDALGGMTHGTTMKHITKADLLPHPVVVPPLAEQRRIADLIGAIDDLANACAREASASLASRATAREEWISWEATTPLSALCSIESGLVDPGDERYAQLPHIGVEAIERRTGRLLPTRSAADDGVVSGKYLVVETDVIYSKIRPELRKATFPAMRALCSADAYPLNPAPGVDADFLLEVLLTDRFSEVAIGRSGRTKMPKVNRQELLSIRVPAIPAEEQRAIGSRLRSMRQLAEAAYTARAACREARQTLLDELMSGSVVLPNSYDRFLDGAA